MSNRELLKSIVGTMSRKADAPSLELSVNPIAAKIVAAMECRGPLTQERLKELLDYNPDTGIFIWKIDRTSGTKAGDEAGCLSGGDCGTSSGGFRWKIKVDGQQYNAGALALLYMTGKLPDVVPDHIDRNPFNNRFDNIRPATLSENNANTQLNKRNLLGVKGVSKTPDGRYLADVTKDGVRHWRYFTSLEEATAWRREQAEALFGEFAHHGDEDEEI